MLWTLLTFATRWAILWLIFGGFCEKPWHLPMLVARAIFTVVGTSVRFVSNGFQPSFPEWTLVYELLCDLMRMGMTHYSDFMLDPRRAQHIRLVCEVIGVVVCGLVKFPLGARIEFFEHNGLTHIWLRSTAARQKRTQSMPQRRFVVVYFHGGGLAALNPRMYTLTIHRLQSQIQDRLEAELGDKLMVDVDVLITDIRKTPQHPYPAPAEDALAMYEYVVKDLGISPSQVIVAGDSAGSALVLSTLLRVRDSNPELLPLAGILACPYVGLRVQGDERPTPRCVLTEKADRSIATAYYPGEGNPSTWGDASPLDCDLKGLPPIYIQGAALDYVLPHATELMEKATRCGLKGWKLDVIENAPHAFYFFPESLNSTSARGISLMADFAATTFAQSTPTAIAG